MENTRINVGVDLLFVHPQRNRGTFVYIHSLLRELAQKDLQLTLFTTRANESVFRDINPAKRVVCPIAGDNRVTRIVYQQLVLSRKAARHDCDVLFCPGYFSPVFRGLPTVVTIHDTQFKDVPWTLPWPIRMIYEALVPRGARQCQAVLAVSAFSKRQIVRHLDIPAEKVFVTLEAPYENEAPDAGTTQEASIKQKYGIQRPYLISVSTMAPHKNVERLVNGFLGFNQAHGLKYEAVLVGHHSDYFQRKFNHNPHLKFLGFVPTSDLKLLYRKARAFALASYYEGFGLPVLEAIKMGLPVACSNAASLPEVAGEAAILFDPFQEDSIADALALLMTNEEARQRLIHAGAAHVKNFSWKRCASETYDVLKRVVQPSSAQAMELDYTGTANAIRLMTR